MIRLSIEAETVEEFDLLIARFANSGATSPVVHTATPAAEPVAAAAPKRGRGKAVEAAAPTQNPDGTPIEPVHTPDPQPTPGGTDAPPAESIPPNQAADPFAAPVTTSPANGEASPAGSTSASETISETPAASSPTADAAGEVTVQQLKDAMAGLLKAKSASFAMQTLFDATGCKSLTTGSPSVVEMAKTDPAIMKKTFDALVAAKTAA